MKDIQAALEQEEGKAKQEHRQRVKLEQQAAELDEKLERETKVRGGEGGKESIYAFIFFLICFRGVKNLIMRNESSKRK